MFLSKLAESKQNVVQLKGVEVDMMSLLLDYAYTSSIVITRSNVQVSADRMFISTIFIFSL